VTTKTRVRLGFAALASLVLLPAAFLVLRTLQGVDVEEAMRRRTVAERAFDEMERALSELMAREEARPVDEYQRTYVPPSALEGGRVLSPLASAPELPFVLGYFEIDRHGKLHSPLLPREGETDPPAAPPPPRLARATLVLLERTAGVYFSGAWRSPERPQLRSPAATRPWPDAARMRGPKDEPSGRRSVYRVQEPGTTVGSPSALPRGLFEEKRSGYEAEIQKLKVKPGDLTSAYDAMQSLNRSAAERSERVAKLAAPKPDTSLPAAAGPPAPDASAAGAPAAPASPAPAAPPPQRSAGESLVTIADVQDARPPPPDAPRNAGPFYGVRLDAQHLIVYRPVSSPAGTARQGLLIDLDRLRAWLVQRSGASAIPGTQAVAVDLDAPGELDAASFRHRFAEPFDAVALDLALPALAPAPVERSVQALALVMALALAGGLVALYRMVSVALGYAERRSNFVAAVSHELKTPLTAIRMYGEMLRDGIVSSEAKRDEYHRTITGEAERLSRLIDNVLEYSRLEKGTRAVAVRAGSIEPVVGELVELLRPHAARQGFALELEAEPDLPPVRFERDALLQVLFNLVDNALKYAREAAPRVVRLTCRRRDGGVELCVRDHGPGVGARQLARVFEPFYRGGDELVRATTGTGIGLALVRGLADAMGATVAARNADGGGFEVRLVFAPEA